MELVECNVLEVYVIPVNTLEALCRMSLSSVTRNCQNSDSLSIISTCVFVQS